MNILFTSNFMWQINEIIEYIIITSVLVFISKYTLQEFLFPFKKWSYKCSCFYSDLAEDYSY